MARIDPSVVAVWLIVLTAALPLLTRPGLPRHTDLELHVCRAAEFQRLLADRPLEYPRWAPDFYYGFGYPIFNYYAPLTYYATSAATLFPGVTVVAGMKLVLVAAFVLGAFGVFYFARRHFGSVAGVVASAAYVFSPYVLFVDPFMRGDAAEFLALGFLPWVFLAFDRPLASMRDVGRAALALAALVFSHNLMALMGAALIAAWLVWRGAFVDGAGRWARDLAAIALAAGLTAVFWLPFVAERDAVRLDVAGPGHFDFRNHFVELGALLRPSPALDLGATTPHFIYNLGLAQWLLALPALLALRRLARSAARIAAFFIAAAAFMILLITPASRALWEAVPAAALIQFPWRFLGPAAMLLSMCVACAVSVLPRPRIVAAAALGAVLILALPTMYPPLWDADFGDTSPRGMIEFELSGVALGTTSTGDFLPRTVAQLPPPAGTLLSAYRSGSQVDRFDYASAAGALIESISLTGLAAEYTVDAAADFTARFYAFAFPGWQAYVDGQPVPSRPSGRDGFIEFDVPASAQAFAVRFESTPSRTIGSIASIAAGLAILAMFTRPARRSVSRQDESLAAKHPTAARWLASVLLVFLVIKVIVFDRCDTCFRYTSPSGQALAASNSQQANFGGHVAFLGFDLPQLEVESGQTLPLTLYWKATAPVSINYQVFAHVTRPPHILWGQSDKLNPGDFPSTRWPLDRYVWDDHSIRILPGTPPGEYTLFVGLYTLADGRRAPLIDETGAITGDSVQLRQPLRVLRPSVPPPIDSLGMQMEIGQQAGDLKLLGTSIEQKSLSAPNFARLTLFWQSLSVGPGDVNVRAQLVDDRGRAVSEIATPPTGGVYPTASWQAGEIVRDIYAFWLPPDLEPGSYIVRVLVAGDDGQIGPDIDVGRIEVTEP